MNLKGLCLEIKNKWRNKNIAVHKKKLKINV